jgi:hypothetical protein
MKIGCNIITYNRLDRFWEKILIAKEYFDIVRIVDSGNDGTDEFCKLHGIRHIPFDLKLNIMEMWNVAIEDAKKNEEDFFYWSDSDEWFTRDFLQNVGAMTDGSGDGANYNTITTPCFELSLDLHICRPYESHQQLLKDGGQIWYKKERAYKIVPEFQCTGCAHPNFTGFEKKQAFYSYGYYHSKTIKENCESGMVFAFAGIMANMELGIIGEHFNGVEISFMKEFFTKHNIDTIPKFRQFIDNGNVPDDFKNFMLGCRQGCSINNIHEYNNSRIAFFIYYFFIKHPNERPPEFDDYFDGKEWFYSGNLSL